MSKGIRLKDLPDQLALDRLDKSKPRLFIYCTRCGERSSAHQGDYFLMSADHVFKCCRKNMVLASAREVITIES